MSAIFKSEAGRQIMVADYEKFVENLTVPIERHQIETELGAGEVISCGRPDAPPIVCVHGAMSGAPHALSQLEQLATDFRLVFPNVPGQSPLAPEVRMPFDAAAPWLGAIMDGMGLKRASLLGVSMGGAYVLNALGPMSNRIDRVALLVPAGLAAAPGLQVFRALGKSLLWYSLSGSEQSLEKMLDAVFTDRDPAWDQHLKQAFQHYKMNFAVPPLITEAQLAGFDAPVFVGAAGLDVHFPGEMVLERAKQLFGERLTPVLWRDAKHSPSFSSETQRLVAGQLRAFFGERRETAAA